MFVSLCKYHFCCCFVAQIGEVTVKNTENDGTFKVSTSRATDVECRAVNGSTPKMQLKIGDEVLNADMLVLQTLL